MTPERDDGVERDKLDYRAGWVEGLKALAQRLSVEAMRANKRQIPGLEVAQEIAVSMYKAMLDKMRAPRKEDGDAS